MVETFLFQHGIDEGGREALRQLPAPLQLQVLAHDFEIGQGGRTLNLDVLIASTHQSWYHFLGNM